MQDFKKYSTGVTKYTCVVHLHALSCTISTTNALSVTQAFIIYVPQPLCYYYHTIPCQLHFAYQILISIWVTAVRIWN